MENYTSQEIEGAKSVRMSSVEKERILGNLLSHIEKNPVQKKSGPVASPFFSFSWSTTTFSRQRASYALFVVLVAVVAGGGTVSGAEGALPGDLLYKVKVEINEPVRTALTFDPSAQVAWESQKAERRLEEAEALATMGRLTTENREEIQERLGQHLTAFSLFTNVLASANPLNAPVVEDAHISLQAKITAHSKILERVQDHSLASQQVELQKLEVVARAKASELQPALAATPTTANGVMMMTLDATTAAPATAKMAAPEKPFTAKEQSVVEMIQKTRAKLESEQSLPKLMLQAAILDDSTTALKNAEQSLIEAQTTREMGDTETAYSTLLDSQRAVQEAATALEQVLKLNK